ncbi:hypothetical protein CC86DRAFT_199672 [Ophiobolus disseminans]|uniref:Actin-like ATPase domain-containing protein n=1 Tax=Ophiobolus disseminans TaxID=1469910 RepID=A0A6A7A879_9PLEO|nr:hypothetical protein CC86DRAFT_199672 [Ophiobolus disseminans]
MYPVSRVQPVRQRPQAIQTNQVAVTNGVRETRLVIGIDFGTTYTGVAFATPKGSVCPLNEITVIKEWDEHHTNADKVPSVISYSNSKSHQQWGSYCNFSPGALTMVHKKLELCPHPLQGELDLVLQVLKDMKNLNFDDMIEDGLVPAHACKSPEEIVTDYLTKVFLYLDQKVEKFKGSFRIYTTTDLVVTVPTDWPYEAMNATYRAITKAGFNRFNFPRLNDVMFITESEAAARYTVRYYKEQRGVNFLHDNSCFVLCDAGGGTVDVVSYKVIKTQPSLQLEQIGSPTGAKCGSIFINQRFKKWLRQRIGDRYYRELDPNLTLDKTASLASETPAMRSLMQDFDDRKEAFTAEDTRDIHLKLPPPLHELEVPGLIQLGELTITREQMESFFDACLDQILQLIVGHMKQIERVASNRTKNLFLVGGFGSSEYLRHYIEDTMVNEYGVRFRTPDTSWTAIVQGAVVCGIDSTQIPSIRRGKALEHSYGVSMDEVFQETSHLPEDLNEERGGQLYAQAQLIWLLNQSDAILAGEPRKVRKEFDVSFTKTQDFMNLPIYRHTRAYDEVEADRPLRLRNAADEVTQAAVLKIELATLRSYLHSKLGPIRGVRESLYQAAKSSDRPSYKLMEGVFFSAMKSSYRVTLELVLEVTWDKVQASISWGGRELARVTL